ncbi:MAG: ABC transporter ATP-binding protein [Chloroflexales bacterium]
MDAIQLDHVSKIYHVGAVETHALNDISLSIGEGEFTALVGPSGSGKTTLLQLIGCLDKPDKGAVRIKGQDVTRFSANQRADLRRTSIGFVFQFFALVPVLTAYENVELPLLLSGVKPAERRVAIARALAPRPVLVLADAPTANLDTANGQQAMEIMGRLNKETGTAFVYATHDPRVIAYARRVVKMQDGAIVDAGIA